MRRDPTIRVRIGRKRVEVSAVFPRDRSVFDVSVVTYSWATNVVHPCIGVSTPRVVSYYCNVVPYPCSSHRHCIRMVALTEFPVCSVMHLLLSTRDGILLLISMNSNLQVKVTVIPSVSVDIRLVVDQIHFLEIIRNFNLSEVLAVTAWEAIAAISWEQLAKTDSTLFEYFDSESFDGYRPDRDIPLDNNLCPIRTDIGKKVLH